MRQGLPVIDMAPLFDADDAGGHARVAGKIARACRAQGFFYLVGHGIGCEVLEALDAESRRFFALPQETKMAIAMARGGRAWRGYSRWAENSHPVGPTSRKASISGQSSPRIIRVSAPACRCMARTSGRRNDPR